jgi:biopolymer transport protein ExbD
MMGPWIGNTGAVLLPFVVALLITTLAGELSHTARLRLMAEEMDDVPVVPRHDLERLRRRHDLIATVRGVSSPNYVTAGRFIIQLALMGVSTPLLWICVMYPSPSIERELPAPSTSVGKNEMPQYWIVADAAGRIYLNDTVVANPEDRSCVQLTEMLKAHAGFGGGPAMGLSVEPSVPAQRFIDILNAVAKAGEKPPVIFEEF